MNSQQLRSTMKQPLLTIASEAKVSDALQLMEEKKIRHLPVLREKKIIGILTESNIPRSNPKGETTSPTVADWMTPTVYSLDVACPLEDVAQTLLDHKISAVIVTENSNPIGIVTTDDLLRELQNMLRNNPSRDAVSETRKRFPSLEGPIALIIDELSNSGI